MKRNRIAGRGRGEEQHKGDHGTETFSHSTLSRRQRFDVYKHAVIEKWPRSLSNDDLKSGQVNAGESGRGGRTEGHVKWLWPCWLVPIGR